MISRVLLFATGMVVSGFGVLPMCDLCARTGGSFNPGAIAGHDADTGEYTCQVALETLDHIYGDAPPKHHCFIAQTWYAESCCDGSVIPNRSPAITGAPCDICGGDGSLAPTTAWSTCAWDESTASPARDRQGESFLGYASSPTNCMDKASAAGCDIAQLPASGYGTCWCRWDTNSTEQSVPIDPWMNHYVPHRACHLANDVPADYVPADSVPAGTFNPSAVHAKVWVRPRMLLRSQHPLALLRPLRRQQRLFHPGRRHRHSQDAFGELHRRMPIFCRTDAVGQCPF